ncbi:MAG: histidine kinase [Dysgonamonadaceae bacterium]
MKNLLKLFLHVFVWLIILLVPVYIMLKDGELDRGAYFSYFVRTAILAIIFYVNYLFLIERFLYRKQFARFVICNVLLIAGLGLLHSMLQDLLVAPYFPKMMRAGGFHHPPGPPLGMMIFSNYLLYVFVVGLSVAMKMTTRWYGDSIKYEQVRSGQLEADLRNLRSQLNPHFLFNTLNNIYSLIAIDQGKAQDSVHRLSNLLRYVLYDNDTKFVPIDKELEFSQNYIDLMKLRLSSNMQLHVDIQNHGGNNTIASLLFITLIENAFKHAGGNAETGFIDIKIYIYPDSGVLCTVENSVSENNNKIEKGNSGIGLENLKRRLELLYPGKHQFFTELRSASFYALLRIDF